MQYYQIPTSVQFSNLPLKGKKELRKDSWQNNQIFRIIVKRQLSKSCISVNANVQWHSVQSFSRVWCFVTHGLQHTRLPCPLPTFRACSNSCPLSRWCHPTISSSVIPFSSCCQSCPASWSFPVNQFLASGGQSIGASASASVLPMHIQNWFPLGLTDLLAVQGTIKHFL